MTQKSLKIGIVMDPIDSITPYKDSSLAMLLEAERRNAEIHYFEQKDLRLLSGKALGPHFCTFAIVTTTGTRSENSRTWN
jgi:glutathione synthase